MSDEMYGSVRERELSGEVAFLREHVRALTAERDGFKRTAAMVSEAGDRLSVTTAALEAERDALRARVAEVEAKHTAQVEWAQKCEDQRVEAESERDAIRARVAELEKMFHGAEERDAARAELATLREVLMQAGEALGMSSVTGPTLLDAVRKAAKSESALATLRQAGTAYYEATSMDVGAPPKTMREAQAERRAFKAALDATPDEHPDAAALRAIRERANDADALGRAAAEGVAIGRWDATTDADDRDAYREMGESVAEYLLGDSGPSGGGELEHIHGDGSGCFPGCPNPQIPAWRSGYDPTPGAYDEPTPPPSGGGDAPQCSDGYHLWPDDGDGVCLCGVQTRTRILSALLVVTPTTPPDVAASEPTPEEDWRTVEEALRHNLSDAEEFSGPRAIGDAKRALAALARLKAEPRRAAEAMRERCAKVAQNCQCAGDSPGWRAAQAEIEDIIRALPLD